MNNNLNNNGLGGEVLGNVNNTNNVNTQPETLETLDTSMIMPNNNQPSEVMANNQANNIQSNLNTPVNDKDPIIQSQSVPNQAPVTPEPAYTNPQTINPMPMPGFENSNTIGTTPPVSLEPEKQPPKKKTNKTLFVVIIIIVLFGIGIGTFYILKYTDLLNTTPVIEIKTNDLEINIGDKLSTNINDYASVTGTDIKNCNLNTIDVDPETEGTYTYQITCGEIYKKGVVKVIDNTELTVTTQKVYKVTGDTVEAKEFIADVDDTYTYSFVDETVVKANLASGAGTYTVQIKVTSGTKETTVSATLIVLEHRIKGYLTCSSNEQNLNDSSAVMIVSGKFAIADDGNNGNIFGQVASEIHEFKFTDETEYANYVAKYKTDGSITINNVSGITTFDDTNMMITITVEKTEAELNNEYGKENMATYKTIKTYFETTLKYKCSYN